MGPMANERRIPVIEDMISDAKAKGASVASGGESDRQQGLFFPADSADRRADGRCNDERRAVRPGRHRQPFLDVRGCDH